MNLKLVIVFSSGLVALASTAFAGDAAPAPTPVVANDPHRPLELGFGGDLFGASGMTCRQTSDMVGCTDGSLWTGIHVAPLWRVSPLVSLGVRGALGWMTGGGGTVSSIEPTTTLSQRLARLSAEARFHPLREGATDTWGVLELGVAEAWDTITYPAGTKMTDLSGTRGSRFAALAAAGGGVDFYLAPSFALGADARAVALAFSRDRTRFGAPVENLSSYHVEVGLALGINATLRPRF